MHRLYLNYFSNIEHSIGINLSVASRVPNERLKSCVIANYSGIAPSGELRDLYQSGDIPFIIFAKEYEKELIDNREILDNILDLLEIDDVTIHCFEADYLECHRSVIGKVLKDENIEVYVIQRNGKTHKL